MGRCQKELYHYGTAWFYGIGTPVCGLVRNDRLIHYGVLGQKWGVRRWQNPDGSLTPAGQKHYAKADRRWAVRNNDRILSKTQRKVRRELNAYTKELSRQPGFRNSNGKISKSAVNAYNARMAELMNQNVGDIRSPSGQAVRFVAKRGEVGVYMALASPGYDLSELKRGIWAGGRVAYRKDSVNKINV